VRGSLYLAVILTATVFAMATGIVGAAVTVLGIMAAPMMIRTGYDARLSAGAIAAGGTLGILIPPSVMLVVMGPTMGIPVNLLYSAAFGPGFLLAGSYIAYTMTRSFMNPKLGPPMTMDERKEAYDAMTTEKVGVAVVALGLFCLVVMTYLLAELLLSQAGVPRMAIGAGSIDISGIAAVPALLVMFPYFRSDYFRAVVLGIAPLSALIGFTLGTIVGGPRDTDRSGLVRGFRCDAARARLRPTQSESGDQRGHRHHGDLGHGAVPGRCLDRVRRHLYQARLGKPDYELPARRSRGRLVEAGAHHVHLLHSGMAVRMAGDHPGVPADRFAGCREAAARPRQARPADLVRRAHGRQHADVLPQSAVAMSAYYLRNVVPQWRLSTIYKGMADYMVIQ
jgi:hypothetical protein